ncbi:hypothetical protein [Natronorarus salvus]|uniref:hypothetical protein n=1 Tax=Natronorarus salvus TaxID=3117733 RepID=UPI002F25F492
MDAIERRATAAFAAGTTTGVVAGTLVGYALGDLALWPLLGLLCGTAAGVVLEAWATPTMDRSSRTG